MNYSQSLVFSTCKLHATNTFYTIMQRTACYTAMLLNKAIYSCTYFTSREQRIITYKVIKLIKYFNIDCLQLIIIIYDLYYYIEIVI
jgi:hypothetical protein